MGRNSDQGLYICCDKIGNICVCICFLLTIFPIHCFSLFPNEGFTNFSTDGRISNLDLFVHESNRTQRTIKEFLLKNVTSKINISNYTTPDYVYTTSLNDTEADERGKYQGGHNSSPNLAIIPCIAIIIIVIIVYMLCHKWFVYYLRKGTKELSGSSYVIVEEDDDDFNKVEILSDSASSAYYDTVSSFCSFLRKNVDDSVTSSRSIKSDPQQHDTVFSVQSFQQKIPNMEEDSHGDIKNTENSGTQRTRITSYSEFDADVSSKSSDDFGDSKPLPQREASTELDSLDDEHEHMTNDSKTQRRMQRFKVSFVTEDEMRALCPKESKGVSVLNQKPSILKPASPETQYNAVSPRISPQKDNETRNQEDWITQVVDNGRVGFSKFRASSSRVKPKMVDVSTQTVRTVAWKRRRCKSESDSPKKNPISMIQPDLAELVLDRNSNGVAEKFNLNSNMNSGGVRRIPLLQKSQSISGEASADCVLECYKLSDAVENSSEDQSFCVPAEVENHSSTNRCKSVNLRNMSDFTSQKEEYLSDICMHCKGRILESACVAFTQRSETTNMPNFSYVNAIGFKSFPGSVCSLCKNCSQARLHKDGKMCFCGTVSDGMIETLRKHTCVPITSKIDEVFSQTDTNSHTFSAGENNFRHNTTYLERQVSYQNCGDLSCNTSISSGYIENSTESISS